MSADRKNETGFLVQGSILAIASIISRILGLVYRIPLTAIIGKMGNDYYGTAFEIYNIVLIISSYSLPIAVSKMVAKRMAQGEVRNTRRVFRASLVFALCSGTAATLLVFFGSDFLAGDILKTPFSILALRVLSPVLLIVAFLGVFRGFFQGLGTTVPSAISQVLEQIINAIVSIVAAYYLVILGAKTGAVLGNEKMYRAAYGAAGGTLGTAVGAMFALVLLMAIYAIFKKSFNRKLARDHSKEQEPFGHLMGMLILTIIPVLLSTVLYNASGIIDQGIFKNIAHSQGYTSLQISEYWGVFTGQYKVLINVPIAISSAIAASTVPALTASFQLGKKRVVQNQIRLASRFITIVSIPCMVGFIVLASPIMRMLFNDTEKSSGYMLMLGAITVVLYSISTLSNAVLQGIDRMSIPVRNAGIALVLQVGVLYGAMTWFNLHIYSVVIANIFYSAFMCLFNGLAVKKYTRTKINIRRTYVVPLMCSMIMGAIVYLSYYVMFYISSNNTLATIISIILGGIVYFVLMLLLRGITRKDLMRFPKGGLLIKVGEKLRLL